jgi:hypothetical protein
VPIEDIVDGYRNFSTRAAIPGFSGRSPNSAVLGATDATMGKSVARTGLRRHR